MWLLTIEDDEGLTTFHRLTRDRYTIGRAPGSDLVLAQLDVSRRHARLERHEGGWLLVDANSRVGTFLNVTRVRGSAPVEDGDVAQIGGYVLRFSKAMPTGLPTPPPRYVAPARLRALAGLLAGEEHVFARNEIVTLGASDDCTLRVLHERVGEVHAQILPLPDGRHELVDKSRNGLLFVNGRRVAGRRLLEGGDAINVGGVALFRYLEPCQQPDPRFDAAWAGEAVALPLEPLRESSPALRAARPPSALAAADRLAAEDPAGAGSWIEVVGPHPLPEQGRPSASFDRLRQATLGRSDGAGGERAFVVQRDPLPAAVGMARWYAGPSPATGDVLQSVAAPKAPPPSGPSLAAFETPVADAEPARLAPDGESPVRSPETEAAAPPDGQATLQAEATPRPRWSALAYPVAIAAALGATVGIQAPLPGLPRLEILSPSVVEGVSQGAPIAPTAAPVAPDGGPSPPNAEATTQTSLAAATTGNGAKTPAARADDVGKSRNFGRRAALESRARSGRASADELRELLSLCHAARDARCVAEARAWLSGSPRGR